MFGEIYLCRFPYADGSDSKTRSLEQQYDSLGKAGGRGSGAVVNRCFGVSVVR